MENKSSVEFIGRTGLLFTNEDGERFCVYCKTISSEYYEKILYAQDIKPIGCDREINDNEKK